MKQVHKDTRKTIRLSSEDLAEIEQAAKNENMNFGDFLIKCFKERMTHDDLTLIKKRLEILESKVDAA